MRGEEGRLRIAAPENRPAWLGSAISPAAGALRATCKTDFVMLRTTASRPGLLPGAADLPGSQRFQQSKTVSKDNKAVLLLKRKYADKASMIYIIAQSSGTIIITM